MTLLRSWYWRLTGKRVCVTPAVRESLLISELGFAPTPEELEWISIRLRYDYVADQVDLRVKSRFRSPMFQSLRLELHAAQTQT